MNPYPVDVSDIAHVLGASLEVLDTVRTGDLAAGETTFEEVAPASVNVTVTNAGDGIVALGTVDADYRTECSRCLEPFTLHVTAEVEGFYTTPEKAEELPDDQEWEPLHEARIDLAHAIEAAIRINLPFVPLHAEECKGICPLCGLDLNTGECECTTPDDPDGPFAALKVLLDESEEAPEV